MACHARDLAGPLPRSRLQQSFACFRNGLSSYRVDWVGQEPRIMFSVVIPVYNEAESLGELHGELADVAREQQYDMELVFVDDGSTRRRRGRRSSGWPARIRGSRAFVSAAISAKPRRSAPGLQRLAARSSLRWTPTCRTIRANCRDSWSRWTRAWTSSAAGSRSATIPGTKSGRRACSTGWSAG